MDPSTLAWRGTPPAWTTEQYKAALRLIAQAEVSHGEREAKRCYAVRRDELEAALGKDGKKALKSMVEYNLLTVRSQSFLARDLPPQVYYKDGLVVEEKEGEQVVTMQFPGCRGVIRRMLEDGELDPEAEGTATPLLLLRSLAARLLRSARL